MKRSACFFGLTLCAWAFGAAYGQVSAPAQVGFLPTARTLGDGGFMAHGGYVKFDGRLPRLNQPAMSQRLNTGGIALERNVTYEGDGGLVPLTLGFGLGENTDIYVSGTLHSGMSEKRIENFYGVPGDQYRTAPERYNRIYEQPIFDAGLGLKYLLKPDLGDGLPAIAVGIGGRYGYTSDDHGTFQDDTPDDGFPDFGIHSYLAATHSLGEYFAVHGTVGVFATRKLDTGVLYGGAAEYTLIADKMAVSADIQNRRVIGGVEYSSLVENLTLGVRYHLTSATSAQLLFGPKGHLLLTFTRMGVKAESVVPGAPEGDEKLF